MQKQKGPVLKSKFGTAFGFKGIIGPKKEEVKVKTVGGFDPARFKTQHKG